MRIGEVSQRSGVSVRMLRHYDELGLVSPRTRTSTGYRAYADEDLRRIFHVEALRSLGLSLAQVAHALDGDGTATASPAPMSPATAQPSDPASVLDALIDRTRSRLAAQQELLARLEDTRGRAPQDWVDVLDTIALLRAVRSDDPVSRHAVALTAEDVPPAALARAALDEDETNIAGALRWAARRDPAGADAVIAAATQALADPDPARRQRAIALLADQLPAPDQLPTDDHPAFPPVRRAIDTLVTRGLTDTDAEARVASALALASVPALLGTEQRQDLTAHLLTLVIDGQRDVDAAEGLGRLAEAGQTGPATASAVVDGLLGRLRDPDVPAAGRLRLLQAAGELPVADLRRVLAACADEPDPDAARILTYLTHRLEESVDPGARPPRPDAR